MQTRERIRLVINTMMDLGECPLSITPGTAETDPEVGMTGGWSIQICSDGGYAILTNHQGKYCFTDYATLTDLADAVRDGVIEFIQSQTVAL